jgi:hypothetical protein
VPSRKEYESMPRMRLVLPVAALVATAACGTGVAAPPAPPARSTIHLSTPHEVVELDHARCTDVPPGGLVITAGTPDEPDRLTVRVTDGHLATVTVTEAGRSRAYPPSRVGGDLTVDSGILVLDGVVLRDEENHDEVDLAGSLACGPR